MQVNSVNNYQNNNPNFTAFVFEPKSVKGFVKTLKQECNADQLLRVCHIIENQQGNANNILMKDCEFYGGLPCFGHFEAFVNGKSFNNGNIFNPKSWSMRRFLSKLAKEAEKKNPNPLSKEAQKALKLEQKAELMYQKSERLKGRSTEEKQKAKLLFTLENFLTR